MKSTGDLPIARRNNANSSAAINSAKAGMATYSEWREARIPRPDAAAGAEGGFAAQRPGGKSVRRRSSGAHGPLAQVIEPTTPSSR